jgi:hypothetical protein
VPVLDLLKEVCKAQTKLKKRTTGEVETSWGKLYTSSEAAST